jgi:hypothetical protein
MNERLNQIIGDTIAQFVSYIPKLMTGLLLLAMGFILGWLLKRILIRVAIILKVERFLVRFNQGKAFYNADVRYGLYNFIGNIAFLIVFLVFFDAALISWDRTFLSGLLGKVLIFFPRTMTALAILGAGWLIASWIRNALQQILLRENVPGAKWIAQYAKILLLTFFSAMALIELNFAREIVIIAFASIFVTMCLILVIIIVIAKEEIVKIINTKEKQ